MTKFQRIGSLLENFPKKLQSANLLRQMSDDQLSSHLSREDKRSRLSIARNQESGNFLSGNQGSCGSSSNKSMTDILCTGNHQGLEEVQVPENRNEGKYIQFISTV